MDVILVHDAAIDEYMSQVLLTTMPGINSRHDRRSRTHRRGADREVPADRRRRRYLPRGCTVFVDAAARPAVAAKRAPGLARRICRDNRFLRGAARELLISPRRNRLTSLPFCGLNRRIGNSSAEMRNRLLE